MQWLVDLFLSTFIFFFTILFPVFKNPVFSTYVVILALLGLAIWFNYRYIQRHRKARLYGKQLWLFVGAVALELYLVAFLVWYVLFHFSTYKLLK